MLIEKLNSSNVKDVLTEFSHSRGDFLLSDLTKDSSVIGIALDKNYPVGLILAEYKMSNKLGVIYSINVKKEYSNRNIEEKLLKYAEKELKGKGANVTFTNIFPETSANVKFTLKKQKWTNPVSEKIHFVINVKEMESEKWIENNIFPNEYSIKNWDQIKSEDYELISKAEWIPKHLSPIEAYSFGQISNATSLWIYYHDEIIGWISSVVENNEYLFITSLFIREDKRNNYILRPLLGEVIKKQIELDIPYACFDVRTEDTKVSGFFRRYFKKYILNTLEISSSYKILK